jgi:hypothetical protein
LYTDFSSNFEPFVYDTSKTSLENAAALADSETSNGFVSTILTDKLISEMGSYVANSPHTSTYSLTTLLAGFTYTQPLNLITTSVGNPLSLAEKTVKNIIVNNIHAFSTGTGSLDMDPGDSVSLDVYGLRLTPKISDYVVGREPNTPPGSSSVSAITGLNVTFVKYSTGYTIDFYNTAVASIVNDLSITPTKRRTKTIEILTPAFVYNNSESLMTRMLNSAKSTTYKFQSSVWTEPTAYTTKLETSLTALDGTGKEMLFKMLAVSPEFPINVLLISQPDLLNFKSANGASKFRVTYNGVLIVNRIQNEVTVLEGNADNISVEVGNITQHLFAGRVTKFSAP